jgi:hypothetical protein
LSAPGCIPGAAAVTLGGLLAPPSDVASAVFQWRYPFGPRPCGTEGLGEAHSVATNVTGRRTSHESASSHHLQTDVKPVPWPPLRGRDLNESGRLHRPASGVRRRRRLPLRQPVRSPVPPADRAAALRRPPIEDCHRPGRTRPGRHQSAQPAAPRRAGDQTRPGLPPAELAGNAPISPRPRLPEPQSAHYVHGQTAAVSKQQRGHYAPALAHRSGHEEQRHGVRTGPARMASAPAAPLTRARIALLALPMRLAGPAGRGSRMGRAELCGWLPLTRGRRSPGGS